MSVAVVGWHSTCGKSIIYFSLHVNDHLSHTMYSNQATKRVGDLNVMCTNYLRNVGPLDRPCMPGLRWWKVSFPLLMNIDEFVYSSLKQFKKSNFKIDQFLLRKTSHVLFSYNIDESIYLIYGQKNVMCKSMTTDLKLFAQIRRYNRSIKHLKLGVSVMKITME